MARIGASSLTGTAARGEIVLPAKEWWVIWCIQFIDAIQAPITLSAKMYHYLAIPMLDAPWATLYLFGLGYAVRHIRDYRHLFLVTHAGWGLAMLTLTADARHAAYRETGAMVSFAILATIALRRFVDLELTDWLRRPALRYGIGAAVVAFSAFFSWRYLFLDHFPNCRYMDPGTGAASVTATYIAEHAGGADVLTLTDQDYYLDVYPSVEYLTDRVPLRWDKVTEGQAPAPGEPGSLAYLYVLDSDQTADDVDRLADSQHAVVVIAGAAQAEAVTAFSQRRPGGTLDQITRCGQVIAVAYRRQ